MRTGFGLICFCFLFWSPRIGAEGLPTPVPQFHSAATARAWGEQQERLGNYEQAGAAFAQEAGLRTKMGDPQGGEIELHRAQRLQTDLALAIPTVATTGMPKLAKWEPVRGCYLGALDNDPADDTDNFSRRLGRPLAIAFDYSRYGAPFPSEWARRQARAGRAIQIAWEPENIYAVQDDEYLNQWSKDAATCGTPVFLRFGGEMNGDWTPWGRNPLAYRRAFRRVYKVVNRWAGNVALVWAPGAVPLHNLDAYYPGDDVVDWVGISLYLVRYYDDNPSRPAWLDGPASFIAPFYAKYAARKPLCLVECGISRRSRVEGKDADPYAADRVYDLFAAVKIRFPRLKMICWYKRNNLDVAQPGRRLNDYSLPEGSLSLAAFRTATSDPYFLGQVGDTAPYRYQRVTGSLPAGYHGSLDVSLSTYCLDPTLEIARDDGTRRLPRPWSFFVPAGHGPLIIAVRDPQGRLAKTVQISAKP